MKPFKALISHEKAIELIDGATKPVENTERVTILEAQGRVLAEDIVSQVDIPPFDRAAMDGYAVIAEDTIGATDYEPVTLEVIDTIHAGEKPRMRVSRGKCIRIATGAMMPPGADAVVMVEHTKEIDENTVEIYKPVYKSLNVTRAGADIKKDQTILKKGDYLTPAKIGVLAAIGKVDVLVYKKPLAVVIPTGNEVVPPGEPLEEGKIHDINSYTLSAIIKQHGGDVKLKRIIKDNFEEIEKALLESTKEADLIIMSGGSSVGERDITVNVIKKYGKVLFHGVQVKPGKPMLFGLINNVPIFSFPGYPTSCLSNAYIFLVDPLRKMARLPKWNKKKVIAKLGRKITTTLGRHQFFTVTLKDNIAYPAYKESGAITSMALADGYIEIPVNMDLIEEGDEVEVTLLE